MSAAIDIKISPENLIFWANMEDWSEGTSVAPTEHTLTGASATVAREGTTIKQGTYSAAVTRAGADATLYHDFPDYADYVGRKMTFGCWVYATVASRARIAISDGVSSDATSSLHSGVAGWEFLTCTLNVATTATRIRVEMRVITGNTTAYFDGGILVEGDTAITVITSIADVAKMIPATQYRGQTFKIARRMGTKVLNMQPESATWKIEGMVVATTLATARTNLDTLNEIINSQRIKPSGDREFKDLYLLDDRFVRGIVQSTDKENRAVMRVREFDFKFIIPDPFEYFVQKTRHKETLAASPTTFTVTNNGNAFSRLLITILNNTSTISSLTFENLTTGQNWSYTGSLLTSDLLVVDTDELTVTNDGTEDPANFSGDAELYLLPGDNEIKVTGLVSGTVKIDFFDRWYL